MKRARFRGLLNRAKSLGLSTSLYGRPPPRNKPRGRREQAVLFRPCRNAASHLRIALSEGYHYGDPPRLLSACCKRPRNCAADQRYELAPSQGFIRG